MPIMLILGGSSEGGSGGRRGSGPKPKRRQPLIGSGAGGAWGVTLDADRVSRLERVEVLGHFAAVLELLLHAALVNLS